MRFQTSTRLGLTIVLSLFIGVATAKEAPRHNWSQAGENASPTANAAVTATPLTERAGSYRSAPSESAGKKLAQNAQRPQTAAALSGDYSIYDAGVSLLVDSDHDGFHHRFKTTFDADTHYFSADVYARLYLSYQGGPYYHFFTTDIFTIDGSASDDEYHVTTTLTSGYPSGYYSLAIDLYEADGNHVVASIDGHSELSLHNLPLEDHEHEHSLTGEVSMFTGVELLGDLDHDGHYHRFAVDIDADVPHGDRWVYAVLDIGTPSGAWLHEHTTELFNIHGTGPHDLFRINAEWVSGYPTGHYDLRVTLFDEHGIQIAQVGPSHPTLHAVPLEDAAHDRHPDPSPAPLPSPGHGHTISHGYGGSAVGWPLIVIAAIALAVRRRKGCIRR